MRKGLRALAALAALAVCLLALTGTAAALSFSADVVSFEGGNTMAVRFWLTDGKVRSETPQEGVASIVRLDKMVVWTLMLKDKLYMEYPLNPASPSYQRGQATTAEPAADETARVWLLTETVNAYKADKYRIDYRNRPSHYVWLSAAPGAMMEVKAAALNNSWWREYRNISLAEPDPALFEIPPGFTKMDMKGMNFGR